MKALTASTEELIKEHWRPHGMEEKVQKQIAELQLWTLENKLNWNPVFAEDALKKATNQVLELTKNGEKPLAYYLDMAIRNGWIANWYGAFAMGSI
jgi:hypothetical protein